MNLAGRVTHLTRPCFIRDHTMIRTTDRVGYLAVLLIGLAAMGMTFEFSPESAIFPRLVSGVLVALGGWHLLASYLQPAGPRSSAGADDDASDGYQLEASAGFFDSPLRFGIICLASLAYCIGIAHIGYYTATAIFVPVSLLALGYRSPVGIALATAGYVFSTWLVITVLFSRPLPAERLLQIFG